MATGDLDEFGSERLSPQFKESFPPIEDLLGPLTPEEQAEVDRLMQETPEYQNIMETCAEIKQGTIQASAQAIAILTMMKNGEISRDDPQLWTASVELVAAAMQSAQEGKRALEDISADLEEAGLPAGECAVRSNPTPQLPGATR